VTYPASCLAVCVRALVNIEWPKCNKERLLDTCADSVCYRPGAPRPLGTGALCTPFSFPRHLQRRSTSDDVRDLDQRKVELWARNGQSNLAYNTTSTGIVGVFLHAVKLRHGTDGFFNIQLPYFLCRLHPPPPDTP
jgi:hypothetical protein